MITQEQLKSVLHYDPETGLFTWLPREQEHFRSYRAYTAWNGQYAGKVAGTTVNGYVRINIDREINLAHRLAWLYVHGAMPELSLDHINGIKDDNRIDNLRECTCSQNFQNQRKAKSNNKIGLLGVCRSSKNRYRTAINGQHIGCYKTPEEAHQAYLGAKREQHEFNTI